jgi:urease accessory protein
MRRTVAVLARGAWPAGEETATATLAFGDRFRRRIRLTDDAGEPFLLDLERAAVLADGDGLRLADGGYIRVIAAVEPVIEVEAPTPRDLARLAWHVGNRHMPLQILEDGTLRVADDPTTAALLTALRADIRRCSAPFAPEPGAYGGAPAHGEQPAAADRHG